MFSAELSAREYGGRVVVTLRRKLDVLEAARFAAALVTVAARTWRSCRIPAIRLGGITMRPVAGGG
jgi:hypothetical protein